MTSHRFFTNVRPAWWIGLALLTVAATTAGGFQLRVEVPKEGSDAVLLVRTYRCHQPEKAKVSGTAEGIVKGQRVSVPIQLKTVAKGVYAVEQQWPDGTSWVLAFSGHYRGHHTSTLVTLDEQGDVAVRQTERGTELDVRVLNRKLSDADIEVALQRITDNTMTRTKKAKTG